MNTYTVTECARLLGVSVKTLQRWDREGRLKSRRTMTNRRYYTDDDLNMVRLLVKENDKKTVCYLRVSSQAQKPDLKNQRKAIEEFCMARGLAVDEYLEEIGGGLNFKRVKFLRLIDEIVRGGLKVLVLAHTDRLVRFGFDLIVHLCKKHGCEVLVMNAEKLSPEREMVEDLMAVTHCFSSRLYGLRNYKKALRKAIKDDQSS
ncbi:MAG: IS607 family transposase [Acidobacteria bacterium]|nr:IS607 family transposase [Acidobacteriota bacterium]